MSESSTDTPGASVLSSGNADYVEALYQQYLDSADSVPASWQQYFAALARPAQPVHGSVSVSGSGAGPAQAGCHAPAVDAGDPGSVPEPPGEETDLCT